MGSLTGDFTGRVVWEHLAPRGKRKMGETVVRSALAFTRKR